MRLLAAWILIGALSGVAVADSPVLRVSVRDFKADGPWRALSFSADGSLEAKVHGIVLNGRVQAASAPTPNHRVNVQLRAEAAGDHLLQVRIAVAADCRGGQWWDNIYRHRPVHAEGYYANLASCGVGERGTFSTYPLAAITDKNGATYCLALNPMAPRISTLAYDGERNELYAQFDFALSEHGQRHADFELTHFVCRDGFRGALTQFYKQYPDAFSTGADKEGTWLPFTGVDEIADAADFYFMHHECGGRAAAHIQADERRGIYSYIYTEPWSYWLSVPREASRDHDNLMKHLALAQNDRSAYNGSPALQQRHLAEATIHSALHDANGRVQLTPRDEPWCHGALIYTNASPHLTVKDGLTRANLVERVLEHASNARVAAPDSLPGWRPYENGYDVAPKGGRQGDPGIMITSTAEGTVYGAQYTLQLDQRAPEAFTLLGWSRAENVTSAPDNDYALYADIRHVDGSFTWGKAAAFDVGTHDWQERRLHIAPDKAVASVALYVLFRGKHRGKVWFDDVAVQLQDGTVRSLMPNTSPTPEAPGRLDGMFLDSVEGWGLNRNHRRAHFADARYPLSFDPRTHAPVILNAFSSLELIAFLRQRLHQEQRYLMGNSVLNHYWWVAPQFDVMGTETNWQDNVTGAFKPPSPDEMSYKQVLAGRKPYLYLFNTNYDLMTPQKYRRFFQVCAFYTIYPGMFSIDAASNPFWHNPKWYEPLRPLFAEYVPLIIHLRALGWRPMTRARVLGDSPVLVERYGSGADTVFAFYNPSDTTQRFRYEIDKDHFLEGGWTMRDGHVAPARASGQLTLEPFEATFLHQLDEEARPARIIAARDNLYRLCEDAGVRKVLADPATDEQWAARLAQAMAAKPRRATVTQAHQTLRYWLFMDVADQPTSPYVLFPGQKQTIELPLPQKLAARAVITAPDELSTKIRIDGEGRPLLELQLLAEADFERRFVVDIEGGDADGKRRFVRYQFRVVAPLEMALQLRPNERKPRRGDIQITARNHRPAPVQVSFEIDSHGVCDVEPIAKQQIPAHGETSLAVPYVIAGDKAPANYPIRVTGRVGDEQAVMNTQLQLIPDCDIPFASRPPTIDGNREAEWDRAVVLDELVLHDRLQPARKRTVTRLLYDDKALYILMRCYEANPGAVRRQISHRDGRIWEDDCAEMFLQTASGDTFHCLINASNVVRDEHLPPGRTTNVSWNGDWRSAVSIDTDAWTVELAMPWQTLGCSGPQALRANVHRQETELGEASAWSCTYGPFLNPKRFGLWRLLPKRNE